MRPSPVPSGISYRTRPYICGAIGDWEPQRLKELTDAAPVAVRRFVRHDHLVLLGSSRPEAWKAADVHGLHWGALAEGPPPREWRDAAETRMATGVAIGPEDVALHTDALGLQDLFYRRIGEALYFSARIEPLLPVGGRRTRVDWSAWASILAMTAPVGDATPFADVKRMRAASAWIRRDGGLRLESFEPSWMREEPDPGLTPAAAAAVIGDLVRPTRRTAVTLSGGWDSRFLGMLASDRSRRVRAWTTSADDGLDLDVDYAPAVAASLGMRHRTLVPETTAWVDHYAAVRHRTGFQSLLHTWLMPLAASLHGKRVKLLDGLAGDVLFGGSFVSQEMLAETDPWKQRELMRSRLEQLRLRDNALLRPELVTALSELHEDAYNDAVTPFEGHHAALTLGALHTRTCRAIGPSPLWVFAPENEALVPFVHPEAIRTALRIPAHTKTDKAFYRQMLEATGPRTAGLPSTNDPMPVPRPKIGPRRQTGPAALAVLTGHVRSSDLVLGLLNPAFRAELLDPAVVDPVRGSSAKFRTLSWAGLLAHWLDEFQPHLVLDDAPQMNGTGPTRPPAARVIDTMTA